MLDQSVRLVFPNARTICYIERETYAATVLAARMEDKGVDEAPIWSDLATFDGKPWCGVVDIIAASPPCQPYSLAGKRKGNIDHRSHGEDGKSGPLPSLIRIISECHPHLLFFENVPQWIRGGWFRPVADELAGMGYTVYDPLFLAAQDVGASHKRERVFIVATSPLAKRSVDWRGAMANTPSNRLGWQGEATTAQEGRSPGSVEAGELPGRPEGHCNELADSEHRQRRRDGDARQCEIGAPTPRGSEELANTGGERQQERGCKPDDLRQEFEAAERGRDEMEHTPLPEGARLGQQHLDNSRQTSPGLFAPGPADPRWAEIIRDYPWLAPALSEEEAKSGLRLLVNGDAAPLDTDRTEQLRCTGNSVVAICGATALAILVKRAGLLEP